MGGLHQLGEDEGAAGGRVTPVTRPSGARSAGDGRVTGVSRPGTRRPEPQLYSRIDSDYRKSHYVYNVYRPERGGGRGGAESLVGLVHGFNDL